MYFFLGLQSSWIGIIVQLAWLKLDVIHIVLFPAVGAIAGGGAAVVVVIILLIIVILVVLVILKKKSGESLTANVEFTVGVLAASIAILFDNCS